MMETNTTSGKSLEKELIYHEYMHRENDFARAGYQPEFEFYSSVKSGDIEKVEELCKDVFSNKEGLGVLSLDPVQNLRYHFVITAAMLARYAIEGGMDLSDSYSLSDFYIRKVDVARNEREITELHRSMSLDYTKRMRNLRKKKVTSMPVARALDYIYDHLHTRITLDKLAEHVGVNASYLSRVFREEMGVPVSRYVRLKKIETAKNMLMYSDFTASEIAAILAFPTQSYFSEVFKKETGQTPGDFKADNILSNDFK